MYRRFGSTVPQQSDLATNTAPEPKPALLIIFAIKKCMRHARRPHNQAGTLGGALPAKVGPPEWRRGQQVAQLQRELAQLREDMAQVAQAASITVVD